MKKSYSLPFLRVLATSVCVYMCFGYIVLATTMDEWSLKNLQFMKVWSLNIFF